METATTGAQAGAQYEAAIGIRPGPMDSAATFRGTQVACAIELRATLPSEGSPELIASRPRHASVHGENATVCTSFRQCRVSFRCTARRPPARRGSRAGPRISLEWLSDATSQGLTGSASAIVRRDQLRGSRACATTHFGTRNTAADTYLSRPQTCEGCRLPASRPSAIVEPGT